MAMLKTLTVQNYILIDHLEIDFHKGFTVLTGETGAGKSIIIGALGLLLGERFKLASVAKAEEKCIIEGVFDIRGLNLTPQLSTYGIEADETIAIRRILFPGGRSAVFIEEVPVRLEVLKVIGKSLIDIHSQHQNIKLKDPLFPLSVVDTFTKNGKLLSDYQAIYQRYKTEKKAYKSWLASVQAEKLNLDFYQHQLSRFETIDLDNCDMESLTQTLSRQQNQKQIQTGLQEATLLCDHEEGGIVPQLDRLLGVAQSLSRVDPAMKPLVTRLESVMLEMQDLSQTLNDMGESSTLDPQELANIEAQMSVLYQLFEVFQVQDLEALKQKHKSLRDKVQVLSNTEDEEKRLKLSLDHLQQKLADKALQLTKNREKVLAIIAEKIETMLRKMGMEHARFELRITSLDNFSLFGRDKVDFYFSANLGQPLQLVGKSASGGEVSRIMFALKSFLSETSGLTTIIFDEIDTGVSGRIAETMGGLMQEMGKVRQVLTITHLPQIAAKGDHHLEVKKATVSGKTTTNIYPLTTTDRPKAIAQMLSGEVVTKVALAQAEGMLRGV